jgi:hypothetical protein
MFTKFLYRIKRNIVKVLIYKFSKKIKSSKMKKSFICLLGLVASLALSSCGNTNEATSNEGANVDTASVASDTCCTTTSGVDTVKADTTVN